MNKIFNTDGGKGGKLDGILTDDMVDSSDSIFHSYRGRGTKGLQQYYTPIECARLIKDVMGNNIVVDLTAGDGGMMAGFNLGHRFGIEVDPDQTAKGQYHAIVGDLQKVYPLLRQVGFTTDCIVINPPFGLMWEDAIYGKRNSTELCFLYALNLLPKYGSGQGVLIAGADRFYRDILPSDEGKRFYAIIECPDLFDNANIKSIIAFFIATNVTERPPIWKVNRQDLFEQANSVKSRRMGLGYFSQYVNDTTLREHIVTWEAVQEEYGKRYGNKKPKTPYAVMVESGKIKIRPSPYERFVLEKRYDLRYITSLDNQAVSYFALNPKEWHKLVAIDLEGILQLDPRLKEQVGAILIETAKQLCPLYPIKPQQRLGFLEDIENIKCRQGDDIKGYIMGESYNVSARSQIMSMEYSDTKFSKEGEIITVDKLKEWKALKIQIGKHEFTETKADVQYIVEHFELPDPGDIGTRFPEVMKEMYSVLDSIQENRDWTYRAFQRDDLSRLLIKRGGLLSWEQGLGKTMGGLIFAEAAIKLGAADKALFIVPQDLIPQWQREAKKFLGKELKIIKDIATAKQAQRDLKNLKAGDSRWYITYYEAISRNGRQFELLPPITVKKYNTEHKRIYDHEKGEYITDDYLYYDSKEFCPSCNEPAQRGKWFPYRGICENCGYRHIKIKVKSAYNYLTTAFKKGIVIIDEGTKIKANNSLMSLSVRGIRSSYKLLLTGTPIKNYIPDAFWLLWWALGNRSIKFPFDYQGGYMKFIKEFAVSEYSLDKWGSKQGSCRVLPEVTNLAILWRLLCSSIIRRRKEETGEYLVPRKLVPITCPLGEEQKALYSRWLKGFAKYFIATHDIPICDNPSLVERYSAILGQLWKLEFASILPEAEPSKYYGDGNNWTPANLKVLELAEKHAKAGDKILIGSSLMAYGKWIATQLKQHGVSAEHIVDEVNGKMQTKSPAKRASVVRQFKEDGVSVLCASIHSLQLGHDMDTANVVILHGLPWDYSSFDQFIARVHRLTSKRDITVYVVMTDGTIDRRKWELLNQKGAASQLALDGDIFSKDEEIIDLQQVLDELKKRGITGETIPEANVVEAWQNGYFDIETKPDIIAIEPPKIVDLSKAVQLELF